MLWIDKWRVFPRLVLICYVLGCGAALNWYFNFEVQYEVVCAAPVMQVILDSGAKLDKAELIACTKVSVHGHPTGYTALMSTLVGAGAAIFGLYVNSGPARKDP